MAMKTLVVLALVGLGAALGPINHHLQQELDMGSPNNLAATAVAAAMEDGSDFDFESGRAPEWKVAATVSWPNGDSERVQRLWGIADTTAAVGHLFSFTVPVDAFSGEVTTVEAVVDKGKALPRWLLFEAASGHFEGVPEASDVGEVYVRVVARGGAGETASDVFAINVVPKSTYQVPECDAGQDRLQISVLVDAQLAKISPKSRVAAVRNLAGFLSVSPDTVKMLSQDSESAVSLHDETVVAAGAGNSKHGRTTLNPAVVLKFPSTCASPGHALLLERLQALAMDGTLAEVLQLPVIGWLAQQTTPRLLTTKAPARERRQALLAEGSGGGDDDSYDYGSPDEDDEEEDSVTPDSREVPTMASPIFPEATATTPQLQSQHPRRHHHGEGEDEDEVAVSPANSPALVASIVPTPTLVPIRPTRLSDLVTPPDQVEVSIEPSRVGVEDFMPVTPSFTPSFSPEPDYGESVEVDELSTSEGSSSPQVTQPLPALPSSTPSSTSEERSSTTEQGSSSSRVTTEEVEYGTKNFAPTIKQRLRKQPVVAGKVFRFTIPEDSFQDFEDGNTKKLRLIFKSAEGTALSSSSWIQFDTATQEVYGLPLEEQVSKWNFYVEAMDKEGKTVTDTLEVVVQHHKATRTVNHEFSLQLKIDSKFDFPSSVDWQMNVLNGLTRFFGDSNENHMTVINATASMSSTDNILFTWTNDSLPKEECPSHTLKQMYSAMTINDKGDPSMALKEAIGKTFTIKHVTFRGFSKCESLVLGPQPATRQKETPPDSGDNNFSPVLRNQVDQLTAVAGELLVYRVPEDTFYDNEDGSTRNMKLNLLLMNRSPVEPTNWLQFDVKNQEFFGVPEKHDKGTREYQLVCEDSSGKTANDGLVVTVQPPEHRPHHVEFRMTLAKPSLSEVEKNAANKRKLLERIAELFGDSDTRNIVLDNLRQPPFQHHSGPSPTIEVLWYNKSMPTDRCPEAEVAGLRRMIISEEAVGHSNPSISASQLSPRVAEVMRSDFHVLKVMMVPTGVCQGEFTFEHSPVTPEPPPDDDLNTFGSSKASDDYLITYIVPAVVIASMVLLALLVACTLYRRRRRGKLAVGERSGPGTPGFRTRGIPVIFQDELDEKAVEPVAKSPVIMKEEKPPLPPPEYSVPLLGMSPHPTPPMMQQHRHPTAEDPLLSDEPEASPYQPPPPFASGRENGRQSRPKPTPTYRKPPPYVPP
ncbi:dystroglycan 1 [Neocloeon triangulifer]|uniref:dystroglycan 1 n=1 Tax=Neocloeon triangulifer TaxID=2078957 RepID=UPI00286F4C68|nr:dystroglycan 1 [Neocloeon triangulifer]XP_059483685.1 dystroglycan 1 [Neocloeon triangulifer]